MNGNDAAPAAQILVVDDDPGIRLAVAEFLGGYGFKVATAENVIAADALLVRTPADVVVLDVMMPGEDGLSFCRRLSAGAAKPAIIMLSAAGETTDRIIGIETGADSYLPKPCDPHELLAHVRSALRRRLAPPAPRGGVFVFSGWRLDAVGRALTRPDGVVVNLSAGEFQVLLAFAERPGRVLSREQLLEYARGPDSDSFDRAIDVQVSRLRRKLDRSGEEMIRTIRSEGYMFLPKVTRP